ncbi:S-adenosyl-L-methionine-dependent methyltransferase [Biscogniauxia mediterranea]|nr:S-adenosyl-L-methionine-dependent methyltransferase [Biscogniauxia mediterranea]
MAQETRWPLTTLFKGLTGSEYDSRWDTCWDEKRTPWDRGGPSWALYDVLKEKPELFPLPGRSGTRKTALVPGCGTGYDVLLLSAFGFDVCGLDLSAGATAAAKKHAEEKKEEEGPYEPQEGVERGAITWLTGNFFEDDWLREVEAATGKPAKFDLIFDYTFFCALPPSSRPSWARRTSDLLASDGKLVCLEFPSEKSPSEPGPPWASPPRAYEAYLSAPGETVPTDEHGGVLMKEEEEVGPRQGNGLRRLLHMKPRRTHSIGTKDGTVQDWISVWSH